MDRDASTFVVMCEAAADQRTACTLADRVILQKSTWLEETLLDSVRRWSGLDSGSTFVPWTIVKSETDRIGIRAHGHFDGSPGAPDARAARRALLLVSKMKAELAGVLLIRDTDGCIERRQGLEQARDLGWRFVVVIGLPHCMRESWLIAAFSPWDDHDTRRLDTLKQELGFDPCEQSHELTARQESAKKSAKRVLAALCGGDAARAERALTEASLEVLRTCGGQNGLAAYLAEIEKRIVPLFR